MQSKDLAGQLELPKRAIALVLASVSGSRLHDLTDYQVGAPGHA